MSDSLHPWRIKTWFPDLDPQIESRLHDYFLLLSEANKKNDIVNPRTMPVGDLLYVADPIKALAVLATQSLGAEVYDLGSGGGCPGIVGAILRPEIHWMLVENNPKRITFLKDAKQALGLENLTVLGQSFESLPESSVEVAVVRGLGNIAGVLLKTRKMFKVGGRLFHMKGEEWATEVSQIPSQLCVYWRPSQIGSYRLPVGEPEFSIVKTEKIRA